jgi:hypothetical protein
MSTDETFHSTFYNDRHLPRGVWLHGESSTFHDGSLSPIVRCAGRYPNHDRASGEVCDPMSVPDNDGEIEFYDDGYYGGPIDLSAMGICGKERDDFHRELLKSTPALEKEIRRRDDAERIPAEAAQKASQERARQRDERERQRQEAMTPDERKRELDGILQAIRRAAPKPATQPLAPQGMPLPPKPGAIVYEEAPAAELPLIFFDEARNAPVQRYHIKGVIAEGATSSVFAHPKKMKSTIVTDAGVHLAAGKDWRGHRIKEAKGVVYFAFERHIQVRQALTAYAIRDGLENLPFAIVPRLVNVLDPGCVEIFKAAIDRVQQRYGIEVALAVFDTWNKGIAAGGGNEDKAEHQNAAAANLRRLIEQLPALHCLTVGHAGKDIAKGERGSNATEGDRDVGFAVKGENGTHALEVAYANALPEGEVITTFGGELIEIGRNEDGEPVNSFIVSRQPVTAMPVGRATRKLTDAEQLALQALGEVLKTKGQLGGDIGARSVTLEDWKDQCIRTGAVAQDANTWRDLGRRQTGLIAKGRILVLDNRVRLVGDGVKGAPGNVIPLGPTSNFVVDTAGRAVPMPPK